MAKLLGAEWTKTLHAREDFLLAHVPPCPRCKEKTQIQLLSISMVPARWRCRMCKEYYIKEPG